MTVASARTMARHTTQREVDDMTVASWIVIGVLALAVITFVIARWVGANERLGSGDPEGSTMTGDGHQYPSHGLERRVEVLERAYQRLLARTSRMERNMAVEQADLDALTGAVQDIDAQVTASVATLTADDSAIQQEIAALQAANPQLDLSGLQGAVAQAANDVQTNLGQAVSATSQLIPTSAS